MLLIRLHVEHSNFIISIAEETGFPQTCCKMLAACFTFYSGKGCKVFKNLCFSHFISTHSRCWICILYLPPLPHALTPHPTYMLTFFPNLVRWRKTFSEKSYSWLESNLPKPLHFLCNIIQTDPQSAQGAVSTCCFCLNTVCSYASALFWKTWWCFLPHTIFLGPSTGPLRRAVLGFFLSISVHWLGHCVPKLVYPWPIWR